MKELVFRSYDRVNQDEFAEWVQSLPANDPHHYELLDGFIVQEPPAGWPHGKIEAELVLSLAQHVKAKRLGHVFGSSQGFALPSGDTVEPDATFVSNERWRRVMPTRGFPVVVPDLIFEILSPSTQKLDETEKRRIYEQNGVREYVLVDWESRCLRSYFQSEREGFGGAALWTRDQNFGSIVLPGFCIPVTDLLPQW